MTDFFHDSEILAEGWTPVSPDDANRLLWHLRRVKRDRADVQALYDAERERLDWWLADRTSGADAEIARLERALKGWGVLALETTGKKTFDLPNGVVRVRPARAKVEITDEPAFLVWALDNDHRLLSIAPSKSMLAGLRHRPHDELEDCTVEMLVTSDGVEVPGVALVTAKAPNVSVVSAS